MSNIEVIGLGALNIDHIYRVERILADGEAVVGEAVSSPGGSAANTIYGLARLGVTAGFAGVIGDDAGGRVMLRDFRRVGVDTSGIRVKPGAKTGSVLCLSDRQGSRSLYVVPGANNELTVADLDIAGINRARVLHLSSFAGDEQFRVLPGVLGSLAPRVSLSFAPGALYASRGLEALAPVLARTHLLFLNRDEIRQLTGQDVIAGAETCLRRGCRTVVVTLGRGMALRLGGRAKVNAVGYIRDTEREYAIESGCQGTSPEVETTGAGDAFAAGFIYGVLNGQGLLDCGRLGDIVARSAITRLGTRRGFPTLRQLRQHYRRLYPDS